MAMAKMQNFGKRSLANPRAKQKKAKDLALLQRETAKRTKFLQDQSAAIQGGNPEGAEKQLEGFGQKLGDRAFATLAVVGSGPEDGERVKHKYGIELQIFG